MAVCGQKLDRTIADTRAIIRHGVTYVRLLNIDAARHVLLSYNIIVRFSSLQLSKRTGYCFPLVEYSAICGLPVWNMKRLGNHW